MGLNASVRGGSCNTLQIYSPGVKRAMMQGEALNHARAGARVEKAKHSGVRA